MRNKLFVAVVLASALVFIIQGCVVSTKENPDIPTNYVLVPR